MRRIYDKVDDIDSTMLRERINNSLHSKDRVHHIAVDEFLDDTGRVQIDIEITLYPVEKFGLEFNINNKVDNKKEFVI